MSIKKNKKWHEKYPRGIIIAILILFCIVTAIVFYVTLPEEVAKIEVELQKLDVSLSPGENYTKTISICAYEAGDVNIALNAIKPMYDWVEFSNNGNVRVEADRTVYVNVEFEIPENATPGEYKGTIEITHNGSVVLFSWDDVPGKDSKRLQRFLKDLYEIDWAGNANISKSHDNKAITIIISISAVEALIRYLSGAETFNCTIAANITINEKAEKATLKINDRDTHTLIVKNETGKWNIYRSVKEEIPIILTIEPREITPKNV